MKEIKYSEKIFLLIDKLDSNNDIASAPLINDEQIEDNEVVKINISSDKEKSILKR